MILGKEFAIFRLDANMMLGALVLDSNSDPAFRLATLSEFELFAKEARLSFFMPIIHCIDFESAKSFTIIGGELVEIKLSPPNELSKDARILYVKK